MGRGELIAFFVLVVVLTGALAYQIGINDNYKKHDQIIKQRFEPKAENNKDGQLYIVRTPFKIEVVCGDTIAKPYRILVNKDTVDFLMVATSDLYPGLENI
jgi:hypothetical protein